MRNKSFPFLFFYLFSLLCFSQRNKTDSLLSVLITSKEDTNKARLLTLITQGLIDAGNYEKAMLNAEEDLALCSKLNSSSEKKITSFAKQETATTYDNIGIIFRRKDNYNEALKNHRIALKMYQDIGHKRGAGKSSRNIGLIFYEHGNYPEALKNFLIALKAFEESGFKRGIGYAFTSIGQIYVAQGEYDKGLENYFAALEIDKESGNKLGISELYMNIGANY